MKALLCQIFSLYIIFQPEIRTILEQLGRNQLLGRHKILSVDEREHLVYELVSESGPAHNKIFVARALVDGIVLGEGKGSSKKGAEQMAAKEALSKQAK